MGEIIILLSGILTYLVATKKKFDSSGNERWKQEIKTAINCIFLNIVTIIYVLRAVYGVSESFISGRVNPIFGSIKSLIIILIMSYFNGFMVILLQNVIEIKVIRERIASKDDE